MKSCVVPVLPVSLFEECIKLRKPRILRFLQVRVDRQSGAAELRVLTNTQ